ncbi:hypothetical protein C0989_007156 [Termitomyces sp. Mn162]|nr:hypothetical protein C0989_007154 [Termitomyces sp. Mn162]KAG5338532.1 hypothetical protein C0989_007156 [Termitomyces sp. Mn162]
MASAVSVVQPPSSVLIPSELNRVVRFDSECVLIPEPFKRSKATKTYTLPLWKKRINDTDADAAAGSSSPLAQSPEETHVVFKVPIPSFIVRSPTRGRGTSPSLKPLSPCLVQRDPSSSPTTPKYVRRASLPLTTCNIPKHDAPTVPLRPCCANCVPVTEESFKEGEEWQEKFTKGARRRRSASLDNNDGNFGLNTSRSGVGDLPGRVDLSPGTRYRSSAFALTVDEVDKRHRPQEFTEETKLFRFASPRTSSTAAFHSPAGGSTSQLHTSRSVAKVSSTSLPSLDVPPRPLKSSPIQEEDEDQLFPLPSPRRTPSASPASSVVPSPHPSPHTSTSNLNSGSGLRSGSDEILVKALSRKSSDSNLEPSVAPTCVSVPIDDVSNTPLSMTQDKPQLGLNPNLDLNTHTRSKSVSILIPSKPLPSPPSASSASSSPIQNRSRTTATPNSPDSPCSPTMGSPSKTRRPSFSLPSIKDAIKGASVDMLKGVSSMGSGSVMGSI